MVHGVYRHSCINCGGETSDIRLHLRLPCEKCLPIHHEDILNNFKGKTLTLSDLYNLVIKTSGREGKLKELYILERKVNEVIELFRRILGSEPWSAQKTWIRRVLKGKSFTIVAPTGTGKTVFGIIMSLYISSKGGKAYIVLPTTPLVLQVYEKTLQFAEKAGLHKLKILAYHAKLKKKEKDEVLSSVVKGDFNILITTSRFLTAHYDKVKNLNFTFIFVDDVDAILKSSKNIDRILTLLGFTEDDINIAYNLVKLKRQLTRFKSDEDKFKKLVEEINSLQEELSKRIGKVKSVLVVSTATGRPRGLRVKLFRELLGFEIGFRSELLRNIVDTYYLPKGESIEEVTYKLLKTLGKGGLVFVPVDKGLDYARKLADYLNSRGLSVRVFSSKDIRALREFIEGKVDALIGVATYYGVMVRGLDLPERVRYAIFTGIPRFKFSTRFEEPHPYNIIRALTILREVLDEDDRKQVELLINRLNRLLQILPQTKINEITEKLKSGEPISEGPEALFSKALNLIKDRLSRRDIRERLSKLEDIIIRDENGKTYIYIPDIMTYLQASGRTSRMYAGGITKGLSVVIVDEEKLLKGLIKRSIWVVEDAEWRDFRELDLKKVIEEIDRDRENVRMVLEGKITAKIKDLVKTVLLVVESPNKARTIANFFGKPSIRRYGNLKVYEVSTGNILLMITASGGHIYDLVTDIGFHGVLTPQTDGTTRFIPVYSAIKRCLDCGHQFCEDVESCPKCGSRNLRNSLDIVNLIRDLSTEVDLILIGTDPDTEGEKIGWDIASLLAPYTSNIKRVEFHEITKRAILNAISNPRNFNINLVEAQIVRRVEDRWIGFELSQRLWRVFGKHWLSAGRVQTPVLGWIIERDNERRQRKQVYIVNVVDDLTIEIPVEEIPSTSALEKVVVEEEAIVEEEVNPLPPFTTDTLLSEASTRFGFSATRTMQYAQDLFELGFITYHRTDSVRVSTVGQVVAKEYLREVYGDRVEELYKPRAWGVGGAHECIRPTRPIDAERLRELISEGVITPVKPLTKNHFKLYDLIFRRFIASQMKPARIVKQIVIVKVGGVSRRIERVIKVINKGFLEIYPTVKTCSRIKPGVYKPISIRKSEKRIPPYTQGDIIKLMKERGIGRPSTYAKIIQTLIQRKYVVEKARRLIPTGLGKDVYEYLVKNYKSLVSEERTAMLEEVMDLIERGERDYQDVINELYNEIISIP